MPTRDTSKRYRLTVWSPVSTRDSDQKVLCYYHDDFWYEIFPVFMSWCKRRDYAAELREWGTYIQRGMRETLATWKSWDEHGKWRGGKF